MKFVLSFLIIIALVACGGGEKKTSETAAPAKYTYVPATQEMLDNGKATFDKFCFICHKEGVGGAAKLDNKERWENNRKKDLDLLVQHVNDGYTGEYGAMTPKGTCMECSKDDLRDAIYYMMNEADVL